MCLLKKWVCIISFLPVFSVLADNGGINLGKTRVIYNENVKSESIRINNSSKNDSWLIRAWVSEYTNNSKTDRFIITPPLYRMQQSESFQLRIEKMVDDLPQDKESIFRINVLAIPGKTKANESALQFAINHRVKLIYRPEQLNNPKIIDDAINSHYAKKVPDGVIIENKSPYYLTLDRVSINGNKVKSMDDFMISPFNKMIIPEKGAVELSYVIINDYGGRTPIIKHKL